MQSAFVTLNISQFLLILMNQDTQRCSCSRITQNKETGHVHFPDNFFVWEGGCVCVGGRWWCLCWGEVVVFVFIIIILFMSCVCFVWFYYYHHFIILHFSIAILAIVETLISRQPHGGKCSCSCHRKLSKATIHLL